MNYGIYIRFPYSTMSLLHDDFQPTEAKLGDKAFRRRTTVAKFMNRDDREAILLAIATRWAKSWKTQKKRLVARKGSAEAFAEWMLRELLGKLKPAQKREALANFINPTYVEQVLNNCTRESKLADCIRARASSAAHHAGQNHARAASAAAREASTATGIISAPQGATTRVETCGIARAAPRARAQG